MKNYATIDTIFKSMEDSYKKRVADAVLKASAKALKEYQPSTRKNAAPEKEVEKECLEWMRQQNWSVQVIESKATYNPRAGRWIGQNVKPGTLDCSGNTNDGLSAWVEFKAPGRIYTLREAQRLFIIDKILSNAFACVVDSAKMLEKLYKDYQEMREKYGISKARDFLLEMLPQKKTRLDDHSLFDEE